MIQKKKELSSALTINKDKTPADLSGQFLLSSEPYGITFQCYESQKDTFGRYCTQRRPCQIDHKGLTEISKGRVVQKWKN